MLLLGAVDYRAHSGRRWKQVANVDEGKDGLEPERLGMLALMGDRPPHEERST